MEIQNIALQILRHAHEHQMQTGSTFIALNKIKDNLLDFSRAELIAAFAYLHDSNYINANVKRVVIPLPRFFLTSKGIDWATGYTNQQSIGALTQNFQFENNYGAVGTNTNFTINNAFNFEEFTKLIEEKTAAGSIERQQLENLQEQLKAIEDHNIPISKGYLSRFSEVMQKHSWVTGQITGFLLKWAAGQVGL